MAQAKSLQDVRRCFNATLCHYTTLKQCIGYGTKQWKTNNTAKWVILSINNIGTEEAQDTTHFLQIWPYKDNDIADKHIDHEHVHMHLTSGWLEKLRVQATIHDRGESRGSNTPWATGKQFALWRTPAQHNTTYSLDSFTTKIFWSEANECSHRGAKSKQHTGMTTREWFAVTREMFLQEVNKEADREGP